MIGDIQHITIRYEADENNLNIKKRTLMEDYPMHFHDFYEVEYIISGDGEVTLNDKTFDLHSGSLIFATPMDFETIKVFNRMEIINLVFTSEWIENTLVHFCTSPTVLQQVKPNLLFNILDDFQKKKAHSNIYIKGLINCLIVEIVRKTVSNPQEKLLNTTYQIAHYIRQNFNEDINLELLSKKFGYTPNYLSSLFKHNFNKTIKEYLIDIRLEHALKMLVSTGIPVTNICYETGFRSLSNFLRSFKSKYGITPSDYRDMHTSAGNERLGAKKIVASIPREIAISSEADRY